MWLLNTPLVSCGHCVVCHSSTYGFWTPLVSSNLSYTYIFIFCFHVLNSVLWCPLRFLHKTSMFGSSFPPVVCRRAHVISMLLCTLWCQFHWIVHLWLPLLYSLTFIQFIQKALSDWWKSVSPEFGIATRPDNKAATMQQRPFGELFSVPTIQSSKDA